MKTDSVLMLARLRALPRRLRAAHLAALIRHAGEGSVRGMALMALLRDQLRPAPLRAGRAG